MEAITIVLLLLTGILIGSLAVWQIQRGKIQGSYERGRLEGESERLVLGERLDVGWAIDVLHPRAVGPPTC